MLGQHNAIAMLAVKDLQAARKFYTGTLGLEAVGGQSDEVVVFKAGNAVFNVYRSNFAGSNKATALNWNVGDEIESIVQTLKQKGVKFEQYDLPQLTRKGDIHVAPENAFKAAWFKDPDGNILGLTSG